MPSLAGISTAIFLLLILTWMAALLGLLRGVLRRYLEGLSEIAPLLVFPASLIFLHFTNRWADIADVVLVGALALPVLWVGSMAFVCKSSSAFWQKAARAMAFSLPFAPAGFFLGIGWILISRAQPPGAQMGMAALLMGAAIMTGIAARYSPRPALPAALTLALLITAVSMGAK